MILKRDKKIYFKQKKTCTQTWWQKNTGKKKNSYWLKNNLHEKEDRLENGKTYTIGLILELMKFIINMETPHIVKKPALWVSVWEQNFSINFKKEKKPEKEKWESLIACSILS